MKKIIVFIAFCLVLCSSFAQVSVQVLVSDKKNSFRGLSVVSNKVIWVSGTKGTVGRSIDGGTNWTWMTVKGYEQTDFRDIEAFDSKTAIIMGIAEPAYILRTTDGGQNWTKVFENNTKGMFLDAMAFWNDMSGIVIGDPIDSKMFIGRTFDGGKTWRTIPDQNLPVVQNGEACFASSGTNVTPLTLSEAIFITGGTQSRLFIRDKKIDLPIIQGKETTGANSVDVKKVKKKHTIIVVGGDFTTADSTRQNCCITNDDGVTFTAPATAPHGYRSCVTYLQHSNWITCGLNGVDYSTDDGMNWSLISKDGFHVCRKAKKGNAVFFAGNGKIGKLVLTPKK